jgi:hypothetical protein
MTITEHGWYIERDADFFFSDYPHRLYIDGIHFAYLTDEEADAFPDPELIHDAWTIIANAGGWEGCSASPGWQEAAEKWRARYHALWVNGKEVAWLTDEQADSFPTTDEVLPNGIRVGYLIDPWGKVPEGWEARITAPKTEHVPWHEAFGFGMTVVADDGSHIRPNTAEICDDIVFLGDDNNIDGGYVQTQANGGTVEVLKENQ